MKQLLKDIITIATNSIWWTMNTTYSKKWDKELNDLMKSHTFTLDPLVNLGAGLAIAGGFFYYTRNGNDEKLICSANLGNNVIWVANHPYASFVPVVPNDNRHRPSRLTIIRAMRKFEFECVISKSEKRNIRLDK